MPPAPLCTTPAFTPSIATPFQSRCSALSTRPFSSPRCNFSHLSYSPPSVLGSSGHRSVGVQCVYSTQCLLTSGKNHVSLFLSCSFTLFVPALLSLAAHPPRTGAQGAEETEGGSQAKACCRCDLGLLAGTPGTQQPPRSTAPPSPSPPPSTHHPTTPPSAITVSFSVFFPHSSLPFSAHCCNRTSVCDGIVFKPLTGFHPRG